MLTLSLSPRAADDVANNTVPPDVTAPPPPPPPKPKKSFLSGIIYRIFGIGATKAPKDKAAPTPAAVGYGSSYKVVPHLDQNAVYSAVHQRLFDGGAVGIFPEGGSHDQPELLPLKAGVCLMALGAMAEKPGLDVKLIPVGLHYFNRLVMECFGAAVDQTLVLIHDLVFLLDF